MEIFEDVCGMIKRNLDSILITLIEIIFMSITYKVLINKVLDPVIIFIMIIFGLVRMADIYGLKHINTVIRKSKFNRVTSIIYTVFHLITLWLAILTIYFGIVYYEFAYKDNVIEVTKYQLFYISLLYSTVYYFFNNIVIKKYKNNTNIYTNLMYKFHSILLGTFYIIYSVLSEDKITQVLFLGPVFIGAIMIVFIDLKEYTEVKEVESESEQ